jgi:uncharacterized glyoxalase superfamily protein PhnB
MTYNPDNGFPRVAAELLYEDAGAAIEWLCRVYGFKELLRWTGEDGVVGHADLELEGGIVMLGSGPAGYRNPQRDGHTSNVLLVYVDDVDKHYEQAKEAGATIVAEPADRPWGLRQYVTTDFEGHTWEFTQFLRDVPAEDWGAVAN